MDSLGHLEISHQIFQGAVLVTRLYTNYGKFRKAIKAAVFTSESELYGNEYPDRSVIFMLPLSPHPDRDRKKEPKTLL